MSDEFDEFPLPELAEDEWDKLLSSQNPPPPTTDEDYFSDDDEPLDASFLAQLDVLDGTTIAQSSTVPAPPPPPLPEAASTSRPAEKRPRRDSTPSPNKKRRLVVASPKPSAQPSDDYEDGLSCAICCDLLAAAHLLNPCGHSFCAACCWEWTKTKMKSTCPTCRTTLAQHPHQMAPNIALDKLVDVHIARLGDADVRGDVETRRRRWKETVAVRNKAQVMVPKVVWDVDLGEDYILWQESDIG